MNKKWRGCKYVVSLKKTFRNQPPTRFNFTRSVKWSRILLEKPAAASRERWVMKWWEVMRNFTVYSLIFSSIHPRTRKAKRVVNLTKKGGPVVRRSSSVQGQKKFFDFVLQRKAPPPSSSYANFAIIEARIFLRSRGHLISQSRGAAAGAFTRIVTVFLLRRRRNINLFTPVEVEVV